ncbi:MAG: SPOR domain-containing protein [Steroidobacteraceae bacterium]
MPRLTTRDYKRPSRSGSAARLKEFGLGVLVGAVLASAAFLVSGAHARHRAAATSRGHAAGGAPHAPAPENNSSKGSGAAGASSSDGPSQSASAHTGVQAPQYDFYRMLPRFKVPVPHDEDHPAHTPPPVTAEPAPRPEASGASYLLQVGSYRSSDEADQVRARLARVGISAQVQRIVEGETTWNRVRIGPLTDAELAQVREQLRTVNIHALLIRTDR